MAVYKYTGKKGIVYSVDYYRGGKRIREAVGPNKKEAQEYLGKKLREIRDEELFGIKKREEDPIRGFLRHLQELGVASALLDLRVQPRNLQAAFRREVSP